MRIGLIADVHADLDNLMAALMLLRGLEVDTVVCAGDLVEKGTQGDAAVAVLRARQIPCVRGNHDDMVLGNQAWLRENGDPLNPNFQLRVLGDNTLDFLGGLPFDLRFTWEGVNVLLAHGTPTSNLDYLYPHYPVDVFHQVAYDAAADVVILGHTHVPMAVSAGGVLIVNPGSVYGEGSRTCGVLSLPDGGFEVYSIADGQIVADIARISL